MSRPSSGFARNALLSLAFLTWAMVGCGGSASETPPPLEPSAPERELREPAAAQDSSLPKAGPSKGGTEADAGGPIAPAPAAPMY